MFQFCELYLVITDYRHYATGLCQNWAPTGTTPRPPKHSITEKVTMYYKGYSTLLLITVTVVFFLLLLLFF